MLRMNASVLVSKIEFKSNHCANAAGSLLGDYRHVVLGSAIVIPITRFNANLVAHVAFICGGIVCNDKLTDYDYSKVL